VAEKIPAKLMSQYLVKTIGIFFKMLVLFSLLNPIPIPRRKKGINEL
jgi:hypothetical protein